MSSLSSKLLPLALLLTLFLPGPAIAEPKVCVGFNPDTQTWGNRLRPFKYFCAPDYAMFGTRKAAGASSAQASDAIGLCCPLPRKDILLKKHVFAPVQCPDDSVATGMELLEENASDIKQRTIRLRCTKINSRRYFLGEPSEAALWGFDAASGPYFWKETRRLKYADLPPAIRLGLRRNDFNQFASNGCVGLPFGSLLVAKNGKRCYQQTFRQLFVREKEATAQPKAVTMFPQCRYVKNIFDPKASCVE